MKVRDFTIIGGGPTGLAAAFRVGMHEATARIIDVSPQLGGQMMALYPEKYVLYVFGLPRILAKDLVKNLVEQAMQFQPAIHLGELTEELQHLKNDKLMEVRTDKGSYLSRAVIITTGNGLITPRKLPHEDAEAFENKGIFYSIQRKEDFRDKHIIIVGGGDSAADWVLNLHDIAASIKMIHRSDKFKAHSSSMREINKLAGHANVTLYTSSIIQELHGNDHLEGITIRDWRRELRSLKADALLPMLGFQINLGPLASWKLDLEDKLIKVDQRMTTNLDGVFAAGDVATFPGKIKLIATGFGEAAIAVKSAMEYINPDDKVKVKFSSLAGLPKLK